METLSIKPCPMCGSEAEVFATGASEYYGWAVQTYGVRCKDEQHQHCDMEVSIIADFSYVEMHDDILIDMWNKVAENKR